MTAKKTAAAPAKKVVAKPPAKKVAAKKAVAAPTYVKHTVCGGISAPPPHVMLALESGHGPTGLVCMAGCSGALRPTDEFVLV